MAHRLRRRGDLAAHLGNSEADVAGTVDPDAEGQATVNYSDGTGLFNGTINVANLNPGETYTFSVRRANGSEVVFCSAAAKQNGRFNRHGPGPELGENQQHRQDAFLLVAGQ